MAMGPREKSELELHWQHQLDHVRAETRNVYRRLGNQVEREAFAVIAAAYQRDGTLLDLRTKNGEIEDLVRGAAAQLPRGDR
jgi:hypothetical protein